MLPEALLVRESFQLSSVHGVRGQLLVLGDTIGRMVRADSDCTKVEVTSVGCRQGGKIRVSCDFRAGLHAFKSGVDNGNRTRWLSRVVRDTAWSVSGAAGDVVEYGVDDDKTPEGDDPTKLPLCNDCEERFVILCGSGEVAWPRGRSVVEEIGPTKSLGWKMSSMGRRPQCVATKERWV